LLPDKKGQLVVRVHGSAAPFRIVVENQTPGVLRFLRGDKQELVTGGGSENSAIVDVQGVSSGDFAFHARLLTPPDVQSALRYLQTAVAIAPVDEQRVLQKLVERLKHHPGNSEQARRQLQLLVSQTIPGDLHTVLDAALASL
jgi:hypothetical protein